MSEEDHNKLKMDPLDLDEPMSELEDSYDDEIKGLEDIEPEETPKEESGDDEVTPEPEASEKVILNARQTKSHHKDPQGKMIPVPMPSVSLKHFETKVIEMVSEVAEEDITEDLEKWNELESEAVQRHIPNDPYQRLFQDESREFHQGVSNNEGTDTVGIGPVNFKTSPGELSGEVALLKISRQIGIGDVVSVPLPHSGLWVTIKPPTERELIDFYNTIFRKKQMLGRMTFGLTLSNLSTIVNDDMFNFIASHIHSINNKDITRENLRHHLVIHDYHILAWGLLCSIYPNGYDYKRACVNDIKECSHITEGSLQLQNLLWIDNRSLSPLQKTVLYDNRSAKLSKNHYDKYQIEHERLGKRVVEVKDGFKFHLRVPTFAEHINDGNRWVSAINDSVENLVLEDYDPSLYQATVDMEGEDPENIIKNDIFNKYVRSSVLRKWRHYVDFIEIGDNVIKDSVTIDKALDNFSGDDDIREDLVNAILEFQTDTTIALVGIPSYSCKSCNYDQSEGEEGSRFVNVIPVDVLGVSFLLLASKTSRILNREV